MNIALAPPRERTAIFAAVLAVTLLIGLYPKEYDFRNHVEPNKDAGSLVFEKYGVAFTDPVIDSSMAKSLNREGFEILLSLGPEAEKQF
ncbi:MAG: hypothetical protein ACI8T1_001065 [Verrucomicrobiales bacterium]|jgi:hypothetical protein